MLSIKGELLQDGAALFIILQAAAANLDNTIL
jgi:hypothetical protein